MLDCRLAQVSKKDMKEHYKRLPVYNVGGLAVNSVMFKMLDESKDGYLTKEDFMANPKAPTPLATDMLCLK